MKNVAIAKKNKPAGKNTPGRGRPRAFDTERAVETAMELFHARGYDGVGVAELGKAIGVNPPSLYAAFGSKMGLFEQAIERYAADQGSFVPEILAEPGPVAEVIGRLFVRAAEVYTAPGGPRGCLVLDGTRNSTDPDACKVAARLRRRTRETIVRRIAEEYRDQAAALADYVIVTLAGLSGAARDGMSTEALKASARIAAAGFAAQLGPAD